MLEDIKVKLGKELIRRMIWENPGITSYAILAKLIENGYNYNEPGYESFESVLHSVACDRDVRHTIDDKFYLRKMIEIHIPIESVKLRQNCYGCRFMQKLDDNKELRENNESKDDIYCALNPSLQMKLSLDCLWKKECPLNNAINTFLEKEGTENDKHSG